MPSVPLSRIGGARLAPMVRAIDGINAITRAVVGISFREFLGNEDAYPRNDPNELAVFQSAM